MKKLISVFLILIMALGIVACGANTVDCPGCGETVEHTKFCTSCGTSLENAGKTGVCSSCNKDLPEGASFCPACGTTVTPSGNNGNNGNNGNSNSSSNNDEAENENSGNQETKTVWLRHTMKNDSVSEVYYYDNDGNLRGTYRTYAENGKWARSEEYILDEYGNKKETHVAYPTLSTIGEYNVYLKYTFTNQYDSNNNLFTVTESSAKYSNLGKTEYNYDGDGTLKDITVYYSDGDIEKVTVYDEYGKIKYVDNRSGDTVSTYNYDADGKLLSIVTPNYGVSTSTNGATLTDHTVYFTYDANGNVITETESTGTVNQYTYITLEEYRNLNKTSESVYGMENFPSYVGKAGCSHCSSNGHDSCIGHNCPNCNGVGTLTCAGCHGSGTHPSSHYPNKECVVCYGLGTQICPNCDGARKKFYAF